MVFTIDVDTGGTFTDGFFTRDGQTLQVKVDTTPHDLTVCFINCVTEAAKIFNIEVREMLRHTEAVRFSSTIGSNTLIQHSGPKLGLIVTKGFETSLYGTKGTRNPALDFLVQESMVVGIDEEIDSQGNQVKEPSQTEVRTAVHSLLQDGARAIVVSLRRASLNPVNEQKVKQIVKEDYPRHYIGAVSLLIATDVSSTQDDFAATNVALLNAYFHPDLVRFLYKAEDNLRGLGYPKPLLITHNNGGVARVAKTTAIRTYGSGPTAGVCGTAYMSRLYSLPYVVSIDIGGTSTDVGIAVKGNYFYDREPSIEKIPIKLPVIDLQSVGGGGGSVAKPKKKGIELGPESAGAIPGPACYDLGGNEATPTDACVVLGYIDPNYFLGGKRRLNAARAKEVVDENIARKLKVSVEEASYLIVKELERMGATSLTQFLSSRGHKAKEFVLFSFGGGGGLFCSGIADQMGIPQIYTFPFSPVFSAVGSSSMDILHTYESSATKVLALGGGNAQLEEFNGVVKRLQQDALRDMRGEKFPPEKVSYSLELEAKSGTLSAVIESPYLLLDSDSKVKSLLDDFGNKTGAKVNEIVVWLFRLRAISPISHPTHPSYDKMGEDPRKAFKGRRNVYWDNKFIETNIYEQKLIDFGNVVYGPAVIESEATTFRIPKGKKYTVDKFLNGVIERA